MQTYRALAQIRGNIPDFSIFADSTATIAIDNPGGTARRASVTVDTVGNRSAVALTPPA